MKKLCMIAVVATAALGGASMTAAAGVAPSIGDAAKSAVQESKAGVVDQVRYYRRHHRRSFVIFVPGRRFR